MTTEASAPMDGDLFEIARRLQLERDAALAEAARWKAEAATSAARLGLAEARAQVNADAAAEALGLPNRLPGEDDGDGPVGVNDLALPLTPESLQRQPPPRHFMLINPATGTGVLPIREVGLLAARGGSGKSYALTQLEVAVATGTSWFGAGKGWACPTTPGRVLAVHAEEDTEEYERRLHYAMKAAFATGCGGHDSWLLAAANITGLPMRGRSVRLSEPDGTASVFCVQLQVTLYEAVKAGRPYTLVILDPLSRFAAFDTETDNAQATVFVQVCEKLASAEYGRPNVLIAHHGGKPQLGRDKGGVDMIRGASALVDGVRWAAVLDAQKRKPGEARHVILRVVKVNNAPPAELHLTGVQGCEGAMEAFDPETGEVSNDGPQAPDATGERVLELLRKFQLSGTEVAAALKIQKEAALTTCTWLYTHGYTEKVNRKWSVRAGPNGSGAILNSDAARRPAEPSILNASTTVPNGSGRFPEPRKADGSHGSPPLGEPGAVPMRTTNQKSEPEPEP